VTVSFRGSDPSISDWIHTNFDCTLKQVDLPSCMKVIKWEEEETYWGTCCCWGWWSRLSYPCRLKRKVQRSRVDYACGSYSRGFNAGFLDVRHQVRQFLTANKGKTVYMVGHSLGGALAEIAAHDAGHEGLVAKDNLFLFTYGSPAAGDGEFVKSLEEVVAADRRCRLVVANDLVPQTLDKPHTHFQPTWTVSQGEGNFGSFGSFLRRDLVDVMKKNHAMGKYVQSCDVVIGAPYTCPAKAQGTCVVPPKCATRHEWLGDGYCDPDLNNAQYCFDEGDCCQKSCEARCGTAAANSKKHAWEKKCAYECGRGGYHCKDVGCVQAAAKMEL
jgi:hypothetical protein